MNSGFVLFQCCHRPNHRCSLMFGLQAELLSGFETYVPMPRVHLCSLDTYCGMNISFKYPDHRVGVPVSLLISE